MEILGWHSSGFYTANKPSNQFFQLAPLFSSTNNPIDIESVQRRIPGGDRTQDFAASVTNAPTITIGSTSRTIGSLFMNDADVDEIGIRNTPPNLVYSANDASSWFGSGVLNKPISDFHNSGLTFSSNQGAPYFAQSGKIHINVRQSVIPEPAEYALVFGLFALAFVIVRRRFKRKGGIGA